MPIDNPSTELPETMTVLLIEPQKYMSGVLRGALISAGMPADNITECTTAADALEQLGTRTPDIIMCELDLPDQSGVDLVRQIRAQGTIIPIVATTANPAEHIIRDALNAGVSDILVKPISQLMISKRINRQLHIFMATEPELDVPEENLSGFSL